MKASKRSASTTLPPFPIIPQIWNMLHPAYTCDLCQKAISEDQYDHNDGLCTECVQRYG